MICNVEGPQISLKATVILSEVEESGAPQGDNCRVEPDPSASLRMTFKEPLLGSPDESGLTTNGFVNADYRNQSLRTRCIAVISDASAHFAQRRLYPIDLRRCNLRTAQPLHLPASFNGPGACSMGGGLSELGRSC